MLRKYKKITAIVIVFIFSFLFISCGKENMTLEQQECKHEWFYTYGDAFTYNIYCPKCKLEKVVTTEEWNKIQIDQEYQKKLEEEEEK